MIKEYEIHDNFFEFPYKVQELFYQQKFYPSPKNKKDSKYKFKKNNIPKALQQRVLNRELPNDASTEETSPIYWRGYRTDNLHYIDEFFNNYFYYNLFKKIFKNYLITELNHVSEAYFHLTAEDTVCDDSWYHQDTPCLLAGVVYLSKNPPKNTGTILKIDNKEVYLENVFNRLVIYNANLLHRPENSFGDSFETARATLVFFIKKLTVSAHPFQEKYSFELKAKDQSGFLF